MRRWEPLAATALNLDNGGLPAGPPPCRCDPDLLSDISRRYRPSTFGPDRYPFPIPNGWFVVAEASEIGPGQVRARRRFRSRPRPLPGCRRHPTWSSTCTAPTSVHTSQSAGGWRRAACAARSTAGSSTASSGACVEIPYGDVKRIPPKAHARTYPTIESSDVTVVKGPVQSSNPTATARTVSPGRVSAGRRGAAHLRVVDEVHDVELELAGVLAFDAHVIDDRPRVDGAVADVPGAGHAGHRDVVDDGVSSGLAPRRIAQPDHQVRLKRRGGSEPDVPCGVVLAAVGRAPLPARPQLVDGRVGRRQTAVAVGGVLRVAPAIRRRISDRRPVRHRGARRARHGEGGAVVGHVRGDPPRSPPVRDESIAGAVAGHVGAEILAPSTFPRPPASARRSQARRSSARSPRSSPCCRLFRRSWCHRFRRSWRRRFRRSWCRRFRRGWCRRFRSAFPRSTHRRQAPERPRRPRIRVRASETKDKADLLLSEGIQVKRPATAHMQPRAAHKTHVHL